MTAALESLRQALAEPGSREAKANAVSDVILRAGSYRWVGIYDVGVQEISVIAWSGPAPPTHPRFPVTQGLNGEAVSSGRTVVVGDVTTAPHYLTTLSSTRAEMVVPVIGQDGSVTGTIDIESETLNRFTDADRTFIEECATVIGPLFRG